MLFGELDYWDIWGIVWDVLNSRWDHGYFYLEAYKNQFGDCLVPERFIFKNYKLHQWVRVQRTNKEKLTPERLDRLNALGFVWNTYNTKWEDGFKHLVNFRKEFGDCLVPSSYAFNSLGGWVLQQRKTRESLTIDR